MRLAQVVALTALLVPGAVVAQVPTCPECVLGLYDDPALTSNWGSISIFEPKVIYVGMKLGGDIQEFTSVEFSVAGLDRDGLSLMGILPIGPRPLVFGTIPAPQDTTILSQGVGGATATWGAGCRRSGEALFKLVLFTGEQISNRILVVKRSYPPTNPTWHAAVLTLCDAPYYTATTITGGCYILNPTGPSDCVDPSSVTAVTQKNWSAVKSMYR